MKRLSPEAFERARQFIKTRARPLDQAIFAWRFEAGQSSAVLSELACFQNPDGGFGRALEPDLRTPSSSALATGHALEILKEIGYSPEDELVSRAVAYLLDSFDPEKMVWQVAPPDTNLFPHAPWWHDDNGSLARTFDDFLIIPRAQLLGLLWHYASIVPGAWLQALTEHTLDDIEQIETLGTGGGDDLVYTLSLAETKALPERFKIRLLALLRPAVPAAVSRDPAQWSSYSIRPLKVVTSPGSPVADLLEVDVQRNLDYLIEEQTPQGSWDPVWSWGDAYPEHWEQAKLEWRGHLTLEALTTLQTFGRMDEI
jgi:hypothetical protein